MIVVFYKDIKKKIIASLMIVSLWALVYYSSGVILQQILEPTFTVNNLFTFSCPTSFKVSTIYSNIVADGIITVNSNVNKPENYKFLTYSSLKGKFTFSYPSIFTLSEKEFPGSEILYHIDFNDKQNITHGLVQVWNIPYSLTDFLDKSKETSTLNFKNFSSVEANTDNKQGYLWDYIVTSNDNIDYKALEYFFKKDGRVYRISIFSPVSQWTKTYESMFWKMVKSFKVNET